MRGPLTGAFQMPVWTVLPCQVMSRGRPTLTESKRPITFPNDDHRNLEVTLGGAASVSSGAGAIASSFIVRSHRLGNTPRLLMSGTLFHSTFGRGGSYQCMSGQLTIDPGCGGSAGCRSVSALTSLELRRIRLTSTVGFGGAAFATRWLAEP